MRDQVPAGIITLLLRDMLSQVATLIAELRRLRLDRRLLWRVWAVGHQMQAVEVELAELYTQLLWVEAHQ
jgi:hypothetical protein